LSPRKLFITATPVPKKQQQEQKLKGYVIVNLDSARAENCKIIDENKGKNNTFQAITGTNKD